MGRPLNSTNKDTRELRAKVQQLLNHEFENIEDYLKDLSSKDKLEIIVKLTSFVLPRLREMESNVTVNEPNTVTVHIVNPD